MMAGTVEQITAARGIKVKKDAGNDNDSLAQAGLEEAEAVGNGIGETGEVEPPIAVSKRMMAGNPKRLTGKRSSRGRI